MRTPLLVVAALSMASSLARAAPDPKPFAAYYWPHNTCDALPATAACLRGVADMWREFLDDRLGDQFQHLHTVRLVDIFAGGKTQLGWGFHVVVPVASRIPTDVELALAGVALHPPSQVVHGSLVFDITIERGASGLPPGKHLLVATHGTTVVFQLDVELEDGPQDNPDPKKVEVEVATAAKQPPFLVAGEASTFATIHLTPRHVCGLVPPGAGCTRDVLAMWRDLFLDKLPAHPHATRFTALTREAPGWARPERVAGPVSYWWFTLIFPTAPDGRDIYLLVDGRNRERIFGFVDFRVKSLNIDLHFAPPKMPAGKHELRVVDGKDRVLFVQDVELVP